MDIEPVQTRGRAERARGISRRSPPLKRASRRAGRSPRPGQGGSRAIRIDKWRLTYHDELVTRNEASRT